jgi:hypothetical protein
MLMARTVLNTTFRPTLFWQATLDNMPRLLSSVSSTPWLANLQLQASLIAC